MAEGIDKSFVKPLPKKGNLKQCRNYRTTSLISHFSKIMLRVILNRLEAKPEELLEEQACFRPDQSTVEQAFKSRVIMEEQLRYQRDLFHNFMDFDKAEMTGRRSRLKRHSCPPDDSISQGA